MNQPGLQKIRTLFPRWNFFSQAGDLPELWIRLSGPESTWGSWQRAVSHQARPNFNLVSLFYNPKFLFHLYQESRLQEFQADLNTHGDKITKQVSFLLLEKLSSLWAQQSHPKFDGELQFKVMVSIANANEFTEIFCSKPFAQTRRSLFS